MPRVKRGVTARAKHKKVLDAAKGYRGRRSNVYRVAKDHYRTETVTESKLPLELVSSGCKIYYNF